MVNPTADFLTPAELCRGPYLLRPDSLTGKHVEPAVAFIYTLHPCAHSRPRGHSCSVHPLRATPPRRRAGVQG
jgi:hypothetical protein